MGKKGTAQTEHVSRLGGWMTDDGGLQDGQEIMACRTNDGRETKKDIEMEERTSSGAVL